MRYAGRTKPFPPVVGEAPGRSVAEVRFRRIGGVDQWVMVRGRDIGNPVLLLLHGGPGFSETGLFRNSLAPLEEHFTLVYWDQRGSGKSFDRAMPRETMTVAQLLSDLDDLVDQLRSELGKDKITIFGHSWGSALGILYASRFPAKVAAYVGSGQLGDWPASEAASYAFVLREAQRQGDRKVLAKLNAIGPPPHTCAELWTQRMCLQRVEGALRPKPLLAAMRLFLRGPETSILEMPGFFRGFRWSLETMWPEVSKLNLLELAPALQVPVFFFLGRKDHFVPAVTSVAYYIALRAPSKHLVWFESSGHEPFADEPGKFNAAFLDIVRPVALADGGPGTS